MAEVEIIGAESDARAEIGGRAEAVVNDQVAFLFAFPRGIEGDAEGFGRFLAVLLGELRGSYVAAVELDAQIFAAVEFFVGEDYVNEGEGGGAGIQQRVGGVDLQFGRGAGDEADFAGFFEDLVAGGEWGDAAGCANREEEAEDGCGERARRDASQDGEILAGGAGKWKKE